MAAMIMMTQSNILSRRTLGRFWASGDGNVAVTFAIVLVPLLGFIGAAVDYTRATSAKASMQVALDSAALMVSKDLAVTSTMTAAQITSKATTYFNSLYTNPNASAVTLSAVYTANTGSGATVKVTGTSSVTTEFMKVLGFPQMGIGASSTTTWGSTRMRVAMALDVTGSMSSDSKMVEMKKAAKNLVDTLRATSKSADDLYISVVPFAQMVNVGASNKDASWLRWDLFDAANGSWVYSYRNGWTWTPDDHSTWKGCVTDRDKPADTTKDAPSSNATRYPAVQYEENNKNICPAQILPMTSGYSAANATTIKNKIDELQPAGGTNQPIGMAWAWTTLQLGDPLSTPAKDPDYQYTDAIILLSDGLNTINRFDGNGRDVSPAVDARQMILCDNIKAKVVGKPDTLVYTIQVNTGGDDESAVLKYCGTSGFYPTSTAAGIATAFNSIGNSLSALRVAR